LRVQISLEQVPTSHPVDPSRLWEGRVGELKDHRAGRQRTLHLSDEVRVVQVFSLELLVRRHELRDSLVEEAQDQGKNQQGVPQRSPAGASEPPLESRG